jgi:hypothetical protein
VLSFMTAKTVTPSAQPHVSIFNGVQGLGGLPSLISETCVGQFNSDKNALLSPLGSIMDSLGLSDSDSNLD